MSLDDLKKTLTNFDAVWLNVVNDLADTNVAKEMAVAIIDMETSKSAIEILMKVKDQEYWSKTLSKESASEMLPNLISTNAEKITTPIFSDSIMDKWNDIETKADWCTGKVEFSFSTLPGENCTIIISSDYERPDKNATAFRVISSEQKFTVRLPEKKDGYHGEGIEFFVFIVDENGHWYFV